MQLAVLNSWTIEVYIHHLDLFLVIIVASHDTGLHDVLLSRSWIIFN